MSTRDLARQLILETAIVGELDAAKDDTRQALRSLMAEGDRLKVRDDDGTELGQVYVTEPKRSGSYVYDWSALLLWVEAHCPQYVVHPAPTVSSNFVARLVRAGGEWLDEATGELVPVDGMGTKPVAAGSLTVKPTDAAAELARGLLGAIRKELE